ncbi:MAG: isoquinoline 1-oxidoreductase beta subunit [Paraglaciecola sp.]|jgi:isoquinoline 1-oxidoreductase beta subunit
MDTGGSGTIYSSWSILRLAGASAREMFITAANIWNIKSDNCHVNNGSVINNLSGEVISYGKLAKTASKLKIPEKSQFKSPDEYKLIGKSQNNVDVKSIVTGRMQYGMDAEPDGTVYASVVRCPAAEGSIKKYFLMMH